MMESNIIIAYGSETGNSEAIAEKISLELEKAKIKSNLTTLNSLVKANNFSSIKYLIIVCSTCGQGDPPKGADKFVSFLKKQKEELSLNFTILGLGDSNYSKFMFIPKLIYENLTRLNCKLFYNKKEADEAYGLEEIVEPWIEGLIKLMKNLNFELNSIVMKEDNLMQEKNVCEVKEEKDSQIEKSTCSINDNLCRLLEKSIVSGPKAQKKILKIKLMSPNLRFINCQPGSNVSILPKLRLKRLQFLMDFLILNTNHLTFSEMQVSDLNIFLKKSNNKIFEHLDMIDFKSNTIRKQDILELLLDFNAVIKKTNLEKFIMLMKDSKISFKSCLHKEKEKTLHEILEYMLDNYTNCVTNNRLSFYDILKGINNFINENKNSKENINNKNNIIIDLDDFLDISSLKYPRKYSISNYNNSSEIEFYMSLVEVKYQRMLKLPNNLKVSFIKTKNNKVFYGETSYYLNNSILNDGIYVCGVNNEFQFPIENISNKEGLIYISNGTGITPMLSYLKMIKEEKIRDTGNIIIISGLRSRSNEYDESIEENVIEEHSDKCTYYACISSAIDEESENQCGIWRNMKINFEYVQDIIIEKKDEIYEEFFEKNSTIMICGDLDKILDDITNILVSVIKNKLKIDRNKALFIVEEKKINGKIQIEKWS